MLCTSQGISNHATTLSKLSKSLSQLSLLLPSANLTLILYPTPALLRTVASIYSLILRFLLESIKFFKASRLQHSLDSLFRPWKLRFQDTYDDIAQRASELKDLLSLAARAELRDVHLSLEESRQDMNLQIMQVKSAQTSMEALIEKKVSEQTQLIEKKVSEQTELLSGMCDLCLSFVSLLWPFSIPTNRCLTTETKNGSICENNETDAMGLSLYSPLYRNPP